MSVVVGLRHHGSRTEALEQLVSCALLGVGFEQEELLESMCFEDWALVLVY